MNKTLSIFERSSATPAQPIRHVTSSLLMQHGVTATMLQISGESSSRRSAITTSGTVNLLNQWFFNHQSYFLFISEYFGQQYSGIIN